MSQAPAITPFGDRSHNCRNAASRQRLGEPCMKDMARETRSHDRSGVDGFLSRRSAQ